MAYVIVNIGTGKAHTKLGRNGAPAVYTESGAKAVCTKLNKKYGNTNQWQVVDYAIYNAREVKMVERTNLMSGQKYMEAEDTPLACSPASETYWSS